MAKEDLIKHQFTSDQSRTKAAENGRKGGIASGVTKREKKDFRYFAKIVLDELVKDKKSGAELPTRYAALKSVLKRVLKEGDHNALKTLAQLAAELPLYGYENVITPALLCKLALVDFSAKRSDVAEIANLDALKAKGKSLYGRGWLLSERKEKERKENYLHLSDRERDIVKKLNTTEWKEDGE